jgi:hypothetical protein
MNTDAIYASAKNVTELKRQLAVVVAKREAMSSEAATLQMEIDAARKTVKAAYEKDMRGTAAPDELYRAQALCDVLQERVGELARQGAAAVGVINKVSLEVMVAEAELKRRRNELGGYLCASIAMELASDKKLRARLLEALGVSQYQLGNGIIWSALLEELFPAPTDQELDQALDLAVKKYDLPSLVV